MDFEGNIRPLKSHWGATEQRRPWDNLRITLLWQPSEQQRPAVRSAQATTATQRRNRGQRPLSEICLFNLSTPAPASGTFYLFQDVVRIPDFCSLVPFSWAFVPFSQHGLFCNISLPNSNQDGVFLWFYLLIAGHTEDEKCCGCGVGKDSSLEYILWNEESLLSDSRVASLTTARGQHNCFGLS